jgi:hypothetical protein
MQHAHASIVQPSWFIVGWSGSKDMSLQTHHGLANDFVHKAHSWVTQARQPPHLQATQPREQQHRTANKKNKQVEAKRAMQQCTLNYTNTVQQSMVPSSTCLPLRLSSLRDTQQTATQADAREIWSQRQRIAVSPTHLAAVLQELPWAHACYEPHGPVPDEGVSAKARAHTRDLHVPEPGTITHTHMRLLIADTALASCVQRESINTLC